MRDAQGAEDPSPGASRHPLPVGEGPRDKISRCVFEIPLLRGGVDAPIKQMPRYLNTGAAGEVKPRSLPCGNTTLDLTNIPNEEKSHASSEFWEAIREAVKTGRSLTSPARRY
jgi:hypothetical protein